MPRDDPKTQDPQIRYVAAVTNTRHGNGLWRGQLVHPEFGTVNDDGAPTGTSIEDVVASGDPITDTKGLGIRLFWRRPANVVAHFFIRDDTYAEAMRTAYPAFHHAAVRVLAAHIREGGWRALRRLVVCNAFPKKPFRIGRVDTERMFCINGEAYRPDIVVEHAEPGYPRIELEIVNCHPPTTARLRAAQTEGALVLSMNIRPIIQTHILNGASAGFVPPDDELLEMLSRARFADVQRKDSADHCTFRVVWRDRDTVKYLEELREVASAAEKRVCDFLQDARLALHTWQNQRDSDAAPPLFHPILNRRGGIEVDVVEDWLAGRVGAYFDSEDGLHIAALASEVEPVLRDYEAARYLPPGVADAVADLRAAERSASAALNGLLDLAEVLAPLLAAASERERQADLLQRLLDLATERRNICRRLRRGGYARHTNLGALYAIRTVLPRVMAENDKNALRQNAANLNLLLEGSQGPEVEHLFSRSGAGTLSPGLADKVSALLDLMGEPDFPTREEVERLLRSDDC